MKTLRFYQVNENWQVVEREYPLDLVANFNIRPGEIVLELYTSQPGEVEKITIKTLDTTKVAISA